MITIVKDNDVRTVSKGLYEDLYKSMGFTPIEDEVKKEVKVVKEEKVVEDEVKEEKFQPKKHK